MAEKSLTPEELMAHVKTLAERANGLVVEVEVYPGAALVELRYRGKLDIRKHVLPVSFDTLETIYMAMLNAKFQFRMATAGGAPAPTGSPAPGTTIQ